MNRELPSDQFKIKIHGTWVDIDHVENAIHKECKSKNQDVLVQHDMKNVYIKAVQNKDVILIIIDSIRSQFPKELIDDTIKISHDVI